MPKIESGKVVVYIGTASRRVIKAADWRKVGAEKQLQVVWDADNKFTVPVADLEEAAVQYLEKDQGFVIRDA